MPLLRRAPWVGRAFFASLPRQYRRDPTRAFERQWKLAGCDREVLYTQPGLRANLVAGAAEAVRQGARGLAHELALLFGRPWGFEPREIGVPARLWYGTDDALVPLAMGETLAREIPDARLTVCRGEGHLLLFTHWDAILRELTAAARPARTEVLA
jgi:pimeloyl-ACP methyl ester carboxylesterase